MLRVDRTLYASFVRLTRRFEAEGLPLTGVAGGGEAWWSLDGRAALRSAFRAPPAGIGFEGR